MKKIGLSLLLLFPLLSIAQITTPPPPEEKSEPTYTFEKPKSEFSQKLHYGGNFWLGFFGSFYLDASPMAGYEITPKGTIAGLGATFIYQGAWAAEGAVAAGPRLFVRQPIWRTIFAHAEYELVNAPSYQFYNFDENNDGRRKWGGSPLLGLGFYQNRQQMQQGSFISAMYNFGFNSQTGFISPQGFGGNNSPIVIRFGYFF